MWFIFMLRQYDVTEHQIASFRKWLLGKKNNSLVFTGVVLSSFPPYTVFYKGISEERSALQDAYTSPSCHYFNNYSECEPDHINICDESPPPPTTWPRGFDTINILCLIPGIFQTPCPALNHGLQIYSCSLPLTVPLHISHLVWIGPERVPHFRWMSWDIVEI